jgi:outer membrane lipoprotein SlyB
MSSSNTAANSGSGFGEAPIRVGSSFSRPAAIVGGATALIALTAIATTLVVRQAPDRAAADGAGGAIAAQPLIVEKAPAADKLAAADSDAKPEAKPAPKEASPKPVVQRPARTTAPVAQAAQPAPERVAAAACATCGVVEAVTPFEQKGEGTGIGAVAGGVLGGVLGNQVGGGNGKKAMTVLGAVGGGMAGHEIEKRQRSTTQYSVKVRMEDGTLRTLTQATAPTVGQKVTVEGTQIKARA